MLLCLPARLPALPQEFPGLVAALGPGLHRTAPGITEQLVDCSGGDEVTEESGFLRKAAALFAVLQEQRAPRTIVFCNKIETGELQLQLGGGGRGLGPAAGLAWGWAGCAGSGGWVCYSCC